MKFSESDFDCVILQQVILTRLRKQKPINMSFSQINHNIRRRQKPNDVFITPLALAKKHIKLVNRYCSRENALWLDPCKNSGNYYNNFHKKNKDYCEILENKDFFKYNKNVDVICSNPPFSLISRWLKKSVELKPEVISYLILCMPLPRCDWN